MGAYIVRRLLLIIPTLFAVMLLNFILVQFVPGGPVEQVIANIQGEGDVLEGITGGGGNDGGFETESDLDASFGARGIPKEFIDELRVDFGFARLECADDFTGEPSVREEACEVVDNSVARQFFVMLGNYAVFDFGDSFSLGRPVSELVIERMPVSISLGLWSTVLAYLISIPLGIRKAVRDGSTFDAWTSGAIIVAYAIPGFLFAILLVVLFATGNCFRIGWLAEVWENGINWNPTCMKVFPLRGLTSEQAVWDELSAWGKVKDYFWHITLPVIAGTIGAFATLTLLTKNSFLDEIRKQYVITAKAKGLSEGRVLYGHVFRNGMLIVVAGLPATFISIFFTGSLIIEVLFSLDGLGRLGFEAAVGRDYPVVFGTLYFFGLIGLLVGIITDLMYVLIDPRIDFESRRT